MNKRKLLSAICLLLALTTVFLSAGCDSLDDPVATTEGTEPDTTSKPAAKPIVTEARTTAATVSGEKEPEEPEKLVPEFTIKELQSCKIVYDTERYGEGSVVYTAIMNLHAAFNSYRYKNLVLPITSDKIVEGDPNTAEFKCEILIGDTNRAASREALNDLRPKDYGYEISKDGKKIVIKGGEDESLAAAIDAFCETIVKTKNSTSDPFYSQVEDLYVDDAYPCVGLTLNNVHISNYSIVYPASSKKYEKELAERLSDYFLLMTGYRISYVADTEEPNGYEILIGETNRSFSIMTTSGAAIESDATHVVLVGSNAYEYGLAQEALQSKIGASAGKGGALKLDAQSKVTRSNQVSMMSYNVYGFDYTNTDRCNSICHLVTKYLPDIIGFQEPDMDMMARLRMDDYYGYFYGNPRNTDENGNVRPEGSGANSVSPILYAKDRFTFVLGDTKWMTGTPDEFSKHSLDDFYRIFTYALLRDNYTNEEFIVVNHHLGFSKNDGNTAETNQIQTKALEYVFKFFQDNYVDIPVIMLGDYNATASSPAIGMMKDAGFASLHDLSESSVAAASIDWIFAMSCCVTGIEYGVCKETYPDTQSSQWNGTMPSDHPAVYAVMRINYDGEHEHDWNELVKDVVWQKEPSVPDR